MLESAEKIAIDLCFDRRALNAVLDEKRYRPEALVELFRSGVKGMCPPIYDRGGHVGFSSSAAHALGVLDRYEQFYAQNSLPGGVDADLFRVILVLHDIGYPLGGRYGQHEYTVTMTREILVQLEFSEAEIILVLALISGDPLGFYFTQEPGFKFAEDAMSVVKEKAIEAGLLFEDFFELLVVFYSCDASSYKHLDYLFKLDVEAREIKYRGNVEEGMRCCREVLAEVLEGILVL